MIGARWYIKGAIEANELNQTTAKKLNDLSPLDDKVGHGSHVAYTAAGSYVNNLGINGTKISNIDVLATIDDAIKDGVDIISISIGGGVINIADIDEDKLFGIGSFHAISYGISFIASGGNSGPDSYTVGATSPWVISVASSNSDREIVTPLTLGNNKTILAAGLIKGMQQAFAPLVTFANITCNQDPIIKYGQAKILEGKETYIKVPQFSSRGPNSFAPEILKPNIAALGVNILAAYPSHLGGDNGFKLMSGTSMAAPHVAEIVALLKAAHPDWSPAAIRSALTTTVMNCENLTEIDLSNATKLKNVGATYLGEAKNLERLWLVMSWNEDTYETEIYAEGTGGKLANPFDFGGGICNPNGAADPGLIYDMEKNDYSNYLCSIVCPKEVPSRLDMNLPSISIPNLKDSVTIKRTVTNVGNVNSIYKLVVKPPRNVDIKVTPNVLKFNAKTKKISFKVKITSTYQRSGKFTFGSLAWKDGKRFVRIPIAVRKQVDE
ncbi:putative polygalacturonase-like [Capsicum annuum]|nr:putative polygalacturonase-like [Capsicum annuum]KAF3630623.1 putative polygalacturonase-like [Capsicum annuum]